MKGYTDVDKRSIIMLKEWSLDINERQIKANPVYKSFLVLIFVIVFFSSEKSMKNIGNFRNLWGNQGKL